MVAVAHLGVDVSSAPWRSTDVIANTHGIDVMIDGHSHTAIDGQEVLNEDGETVLLNQTGTKLAALGQVVIDPDTGEISAGLITEYQERDQDTQAFVDSINQEFSTVLSQVVASTDVALTTVDPSTGERIIRSQETNLGDLCADAYREVLDADVGLINGGGIRADIAAGEITYGDIISVHPYNNQATSVRVTGQQLLDALELGARYTPYENGGFLHASGLDQRHHHPLLRGHRRAGQLCPGRRRVPGERRDGGRGAPGSGAHLCGGLPRLHAPLRRRRHDHV